MNNEFLQHVAQLADTDAQLTQLAAQLKPWAEYREKLVQFIIATHLRDYRNGSHTFALPDGRTVEFEKGESVKVLEEHLPLVFDCMINAQDRPEGVPYTDEQVRALHQLHKLVRWAPSLDKRQWDKLSDESKALFEPALLRTPSKPSLKIKDAK